MPRFRNPVVSTADIADGSVTTPKLADGSVTSQKISTDLQSDNWDGTTVAAQDATQGWRIERDTGAIGVDSGFFRGDVFSGADPNKVTISGGIITVGSGDHQVIIDSSSVGLLDSPKVEFWADAIQIGRIYGVASGGAAHSMAYSALNGAEHIFAGGDVWISNNSLRVISDSGFADAWLNDQGRVLLDYGSLSAPGLAFTNDQDCGLRRWGSNAIALVTAGTDRLLMDGTGVVFYPTHPTTSNGANMWISSSNGNMRRSTSSERYKTAIRRWDRRASVLDLTPSLYRSRLAGDDGRHVRLGLIAEDVAAHFPLAAVTDDEGRPDAIDWPVVTTGLLAELAALERRVAALEAA